MMTPPEVLVTFLRGGLRTSNSIEVPRILRPCVNKVGRVHGGWLYGLGWAGDRIEFLRGFLETIKFDRCARGGRIRGLVQSVVVRTSRHDCAAIKGGALITRFSEGFTRSVKVTIYKRFSRSSACDFSCCLPCLHSSLIDATRSVSVRHRTTGRSCTKVYSSPGIKISLVFCLRGVVSCLGLRKRNGVPTGNASLGLSTLSYRKAVVVPVRGAR